MYGLILFVRTLSPHAQLLHSQLRVGEHANVKAWAVRTNHGTAQRACASTRAHAART